MTNYVFTLNSIIRAIIWRRDLGADHPEVQMLMHMMYEEYLPVLSEGEPIGRERYGRARSSGFMEGDIGQVNMKNYGKEYCEFIADAIAVFGGYKDYEEVGDEGKQK